MAYRHAAGTSLCSNDGELIHRNQGLQLAVRKSARLRSAGDSRSYPDRPRPPHCNPRLTTAAGGTCVSSRYWCTSPSRATCARGDAAVFTDAHASLTSPLRARDPQGHSPAAGDRCGFVAFDTDDLR